MRKLLISLIFIPFILIGCSNTTETDENRVTISLPTSHSELTANGYRNPALAVSSSSSSGVIIVDDSLTYVASKNSKIFHIIDCSSAKKIKEENIIIFEDYEDASTNGYTPCSKCLKID